MAGVAIENTFKAWIDKMPPAGDTLHVTGKVEFPTSGYKAELVEAVPQGINPKILILEVKETPPTGTVLEVVTRLDVHFTRRPSGDVTEVTVRSDGRPFTIPVTIAH